MSTRNKLTNNEDIAEISESYTQKERKQDLTPVPFHDKTPAAI